MSLTENYRGDDKTILGILAIADLITLPILLVVAVILALLGVFTLANLFGTLFNFTVIALSFLLVIILFLIGRNRKNLIRVHSVKFGIGLGFFYWVFTIYEYLQHNALGLAVLNAINIPLLFAYMIAFILWIIIFKSLFAFFSS